MNERGFTLLEILVALTILAVAAAGLASAMGQSLGQQARLEDKTFAGWVAENRLVEMRAARLWPEIGTHSETVSLAGCDWKLRIAISPTANPDLRKVELAVGAQTPPDASPVVTLTGFVGRH